MNIVDTFSRKQDLLVSKETCLIK